MIKQVYYEWLLSSEKATAEEMHYFSLYENKMNIVNLTDWWYNFKKIL